MIVQRRFLEMVRDRDSLLAVELDIFVEILSMDEIKS